MPASASHGEPVDPWMTNSSPMRAKPVGNTTGWPSRTSAIVASGVLSRSSSRLSRDVSCISRSLVTWVEGVVDMQPG
ncbi:MAG: hypothetical protein QOF92_3945 [Pseudonocardiales bacterium]|nr:hypothetical protein [Pseudonocardiales bacterium]